jgi:hypothetical protein
VKWNTQRKAVVAVLALAGAAFCVDRFVLGYGPQTAAAAETTADIVTSAPSSPAAAARSRPAERTATLTQRIAALSISAAGPELPATTDALCVPASWSELIREADPPKGLAATAAPAGHEPERFTVSSVFLGNDPTKAAARINGRLVRVGQTIRGHEFLRIEPGSPSIVVLAGPDGEVRVPLTIGGDNANPDKDDVPESGGRS